MGRHLLASIVVLGAALSGSGCYLSHELGGADAGPDLGRNVCTAGETQPVPCGRCGVALRDCMGDVWGPPGECTGETATCGLDVMLLADVTGSHTGVFQGSRDALASELIVPLEAAADMRVGVSAFADYPAGSYGSAPDQPFIGVLPPTHDVVAVEAAITDVMFLGGGDKPEAEIEGLNDLAGGVPHPTASPFVCTSGVGGGCWREGAPWRVIVVMTDTASHALPSPRGGLVKPYGGDLVPPAPRWDTVRALLVASGTYVYWIVPDDAGTGDAQTDFVSASEQAAEIARELGEDPAEAVSTYTGATTDAIRTVETRILSHFGIVAH